MIQNLDDVKMVLQTMWPKLGHQSGRQYHKPNNYHYQLYHFRSHGQTISSNWQISIVCENNGTTVEIFFKLLDDMIEYVDKVKMRSQKLVLNKEYTNIVDDLFLGLQLRDFARTFLSPGLLAQI